MKNNKFTFIDLFAGIGGFRMALDNVGGNCLGFSEINNDAINTYCQNFSENPDSNFGDITKLQSLPESDLITAGVPCQSWSIAGKNLGFDDDRGQLWNDTIYLLKQSKPKAFIFENVKGLVDPRNKKALLYILERIKEAGYYAKYYVINSFDYGVPQNRIRIYIIGFKEKLYLDKFQLPNALNNNTKLGDLIFETNIKTKNDNQFLDKDLFGEISTQRSMSLSSKNGFNDYFLFNDLRNGHSTIHSWDIINTSKKQKEICYLLLKNRRKSAYGKLDGNPLSLKHFKNLDATISKEELDDLVNLEILKEVEYSFSINKFDKKDLSDYENDLLELTDYKKIDFDDLKNNRVLKLKKIPLTKTLESLKIKNIIECTEIRYDFKNTKISTGLFGINRIFLPTSSIFPTLVASDTNDFISTVELEPTDMENYKSQFIKEIYNKKNYRKITKEEACAIQGFPKDFILPESRNRWMKLIGNSVSVPVIEMLSKAILKTDVFKTNQDLNQQSKRMDLQTYR
ncbi:DNA cytosine methyltransferase [Mariniflexile sp.]|uniref:DNA cytosine methyltransferase n=2 Tax=Mariniflexile sp. TaxID=1979402 RepID=UPI004048B45F